jgi:hypothetical protein
MRLKGDADFSLNPAAVWIVLLLDDGRSECPVVPAILLRLGVGLAFLNARSTSSLSDTTRLD